MAIAINGSGTITGISQGGLNDNIITQSELANTGVAGNGPAFSAYRATPSQLISASTWTKVQLNTEEFDTNNNFDSATNYRFTPTVAGYYLISGAIFFSASVYGVVNRISIYKNGSSYKQALWVGNSGVGLVINQTILTVSSIIYFNGSTDYVELYGLSDYSSGANFVGGIDSTYMSGALVRAA